MKSVLVWWMIMLFAASCARLTTGTTVPITPAVIATVTPGSGAALSDEDATTLASLHLVDAYPLYTMHYTGFYDGEASTIMTLPSAALQPPAAASCHEQWGCSLFAALGDERDRLLGRNFDWQFSPALLLFTQPEDGYASVSMVDIAYLGFAGERSKNITSLPLAARQRLLDAAWLPFDGMNAAGIAVGMAAVPAGNMPSDPKKKTIDELQAIREVLDHAGTVDEAIHILGSYNLDMGSVPIHYLIGSAAGESALVEFYEGKMVVFRNKRSWQTATNFLVASTNGQPAGNCPRYDHMSRTLDESGGRISPSEAALLLQDVSQDTTQWSIVYHMTTGEVSVVMGRSYSRPSHTFRLADPP